ncbi:MAG: HNH endonuclease [Planctomycetes bacterium]|nr:HNH endonuclease [Planctomycetota bacterium]
MSFSEEDRTNALLWCDRHCCQCKKQCGVNIEVHHIVPEVDGGDDDIENAIPLCFDCHCDVGGYCNKHPIGNKYYREQ